MYHEEDYQFCRSIMASDEHILWHGKPEPGRTFTKQDIIMIPFSLLWCGFAIFWTVSASSAGGFFGLFGIPFVLVGLYMVFGRFIHGAYVRKNSYYVITNKRIYRRIGKKIDFLAAVSMPPYHTVIHKNGCGSVYFQNTDVYRGRGYRSSGSYSSSLSPTHGFSLENLSDIGRVQQAIEQMDR